MEDRECETAVFRILQEALTNVARHANATQVDIKFEEKDGSLLLEVKDNGRGIDEKELSKARSFGILGIQERAFLLGGEVDIHGEPQKGTKISLRIPLQSLIKQQGIK